MRRLFPLIFLTAAQIADLTKAQIDELQKALPNYDIISNAKK